SASWSTVVRRLYENQTLCLPALALLLVPLALVLPSRYGWMAADVNASDVLWQAKRPYLNRPAFVLRAVIYLPSSPGLAWRMRSWSVQQDKRRDPGLT